MTVENELDAYISGFHLNALSSGLPLNVDIDTTLTVIAGNLDRLLARKLPRYENATKRCFLPPGSARRPPPNFSLTSAVAAPTSSGSNRPGV
jgi:hypothetical protein